MVPISDTYCTSSMEPSWEFLAPQYVDFNNLEEEGEGDSFFTAHEEESGQEVGEGEDQEVRERGDQEIGQTRPQDVDMFKQKNTSGNTTIAMHF